MERLEDHPYYAFFTTIVKKYAIEGNPFLSKEDLLQEVFLISLQIERDQAKWRDPERVLRRAVKLKVLNLLRNNGRAKKNFPRYKAMVRQGNERIAWEMESKAGSDFLEIELQDFLEVLRKRVSSKAEEFLSELENPSLETIRLGEEARLRRVHIKAQGKQATKLNKIVISHEIIRRKMKISDWELYQLKKEIKQQAIELRAELQDETLDSDENRKNEFLLSMDL